MTPHEAGHDHAPMHILRKQRARQKAQEWAAMYEAKMERERRMELKRDVLVVSLGIGIAVVLFAASAWMRGWMS